VPKEKTPHGALPNTPIMPLRAFCNMNTHHLTTEFLVNKDSYNALSRLADPKHKILCNRA